MRRAGPRSFRCATPVMGAAVAGTAEADGIQAHEIPLAAADGHRYPLPARVPAHADRSLFWLPALGVAARHYSSAEHTSALQSLMRTSYAVFRLKQQILYQ